jgi:hypothetical protein
VNNDHDRQLSKALASRIALAKEELMARMIEQGYTPAAGWRITEKIKTGVGRIDFVFCPTHLRHDTPDLEISVGIDEEGEPV